MLPVSQPFAAATFQEPWSASAWDSLRLFSLHLVAIGGSGALARTALAPLERIKVLMPTQSRCCQQIHCQSDPVPLRLTPVQILLQVESISNTPPMQRYGSFNHAIWRINQREGFKVCCGLVRSKARNGVESTEQIYTQSQQSLKRLAGCRLTLGAMEPMYYAYCLTLPSNLLCMISSRSCLPLLMAAH